MIVDQRILNKYPGPAAPQTTVAPQTGADRLKFREFFSQFPTYVRDDQLRRASYIDLAAGQHIFRSGDKETFMGAVLTGRLRMGMQTTAGKGVLLGLVEPEEMFGEMSLIDGLPRTIDAKAEVQTHLILFRRDDMLPVLMQYPDAMYNLIRTLCHRLRFYTDTIDMMASHNLPMRLAHCLLRMASEYGEENIEGRIVIRAHLSQEAIGMQINVTRECINKNLKALAARKLIAVRGEEITILDPAGLRSLAG